MAKVKIKVSDVEVGYSSKNKNNKSLISKINISAEKGECIALIGVNGSGKSTLLRSISGFQRTLSGNILIDDINVNEYTNLELAKKLSIVTSDIINTRFLKVIDLVSLGRFPHKSFSSKQTNKDIKIVRNALSVTGILHLVEKNINKISDGERQKVMIARALSQDTDIILLDEPTAFLDIENKYSVYKILSKTAKEQNKTVIFSTHDLNIALKYSDKVWLIKDKQIFEGALEDLILKDVFNHLFKNKEVEYNKKTNEFSVVFEEKYPVNFISNINLGLINDLTISSLRRNGFFISKYEKNIKIVLNENKTWVVFNNKNKYTCNSIYEMIRKLQFLIQK